MAFQIIAIGQRSEALYAVSHALTGWVAFICANLYVTNFFCAAFMSKLLVLNYITPDPKMRPACARMPA
jgi:hypothetical protein